MSLALAVTPARDTRPQSWRCTRCDKKLGEVQGNRVSIRHRGRQIEARLPCWQVCDQCQTFNTLDTAPGTEGR